MKKKLIILGVVLIILIGLTFWLSKNNEELGVVSFYPKRGEGNVGINALFKINFNKKPRGVEYVIKPVLEVEEKIVENSLVLRPVRDLPFDTFINIYVLRDGEELGDWYFKTRRKTEVELVEEEEELTKRYSPLASYLPYSARSFKMYYVGKLKLKVIYVGDLDGVKDKVYEFIKSKKVDPETHTYEWEEEVKSL